MEHKRKQRTSPADIEDLRADERILADVANNARKRVNECPHCDLGWILYEGDDGKKHQAWACTYCVPHAKETNRSWRAVRDQLADAGVEVDTLIPYAHPFIPYEDQRGAEMVGHIAKAWREYREGLIDMDELERQAGIVPPEKRRTA